MHACYIGNMSSEALMSNSILLDRQLMLASVDTAAVSDLTLSVLLPLC